MKRIHLSLLIAAVLSLPAILLSPGCKPQNPVTAVEGDAAGKVYVAPGKYDEFYNIVSGGFSGQVSVYGLPSGRLFRVIPVFFTESGKRMGL